MNADLATWFKTTFIEVQEYEFGVYPAVTDMVNQTKKWQCFGCNATATTCWSTWGDPDFIHEPRCKYLEFMHCLNGAEQ